ncbi:MAG: Hsp20/alpha crystallin family protein [Chloroflexi bacterium]|nr:Hsp20/alpha crystallin family protein [Chloroflexota bacterium]
MSMIRWEPFGDLLNLRHTIDRMFDPLMRGGHWGLGDGGRAFTPLEVYEQDDAVIVRAALPDVRPEEIEITTSGDTVTLKGEHRPTEGIKPEQYLLQEWPYGKFVRSVTLPISCQMEKAEADFDRGVLTLRIPKAEKVRSRTIQVKSHA